MVATCYHEPDALQDDFHGLDKLELLFVGLTLIVANLLGVLRRPERAFPQHGDGPLDRLRLLAAGRVAQVEAAVGLVTGVKGNLG